MRRLSDQARDLIDEVADAIEECEERKDKYEAGREVIVSYFEQNPKATYAVSQASKYLLLRMREKAAA